MRSLARGWLAMACTLAVLFTVCACAPLEAEDRTPAGLTLVVMDPLASPLSCPCVKGYAQRDYDKLAAYLEKQLGRPVTVAYSDSLTTALQKKTEGKADIIIGKRSVVEFDARNSKLDVVPVADLTGKDGLTTMTGLIVVPKDDPAKTAADLKGYRIIFGSPECDEKYAAPITLLKSKGVTLPEKLETSASCADGATAILEARSGKGAAVISSYAKPLLEGCGTINKGDLRVVGETEPVPFITAFVSSRLSKADSQAITDALLAVKSDLTLRTVLETKNGFVPAAKAVGTSSKKN